MSRAFTILLALLIASFFFVPDQHQRNWFLYLAAATAHGFLFNRHTLATAFAGRAGFTVPLLLAVPVLSLAWSGPVAGEQAADLLLAAYCILVVYVGVAHLSRHTPRALERLQQTLLAGANLGALLSLAHWAATYEPGLPRLRGVLGLDNPVHASILLLAATLPVCTGVARGTLGRRWFWACAAPLGYVLVAGARTALAAYVLVVAVNLGLRLRRRTLVAAAAVIGLAAAVALMGSDALRAIWLDRGLSYRPEIWAQAWAAWSACNPLVGCGIAAPLGVEYLPGTVTDRAHSLYVAALYHQGLLGAAVFLGAVGWLLYCSRGTSTAMRDDGARGRRWAALPGCRRDWLVVLVYVLLASATSGDHILVRTTLFWCYFWLPVMVLAAPATALTGTENSAADSA